jgi:PIN domain nuclease of toxin-antitoxin system
MNLLLDTHVFLWCELQPERLSAKVQYLFEDEGNQFALSVASVWEMQIKMQAGRLTLERSIEEIIHRQQRENQLRVLPIELPHVLALQDLPPHHKDPFDRLLVCQAKVERLVIVSADKALSDYPVEVLW